MTLVRQQRLSTQLAPVDQLGAARPAAILGDVGAIEAP
jgi:hypothetical protein